MRSRWVLARHLLEHGKLFEAPARRARAETIAGTSIAKLRQAQQQPQQRVFDPPPAVMGEFEHEEPSLASRTRPDLPSAAERHRSLVDAYTHPRAKTVHTRHAPGSANNVHFAKVESGANDREKRIVVKPLKNAGAGHEKDEKLANPNWQSDRWASRHNAVYAVAAAMGSHHMVAPGFGGKAHGDDRMGPNVRIGEKPAEDASIRDRMSSVHAHMGEDSHIQEHVHDAVPIWLANEDDLKNVDGEHRLHGIVRHVLFSNNDGNSGNVLLHPSGHTIDVDHDLILSSRQQSGALKRVMTPYAEGGVLDYRHKMDGVGKNYPPRMKKTLEWLAAGGHVEDDHSLGLEKDDALHLQKNARDLLVHGLEKTLARRKVKSVSRFDLAQRRADMRAMRKELEK